MKMEGGKSWEMSRFFFVFLFFCFVLFCFVLVCFVLFFFFAFHFSKRRKFVLPKWKFSTGKKHFTPGKYQENDFAPSEKFFCYAPVDMGNKKRPTKLW